MVINVIVFVPGIPYLTNCCSETICKWCILLAYWDYWLLEGSGLRKCRKKYIASMIERWITSKIGHIMPKNINYIVFESRGFFWIFRHYVFCVLIWSISMIENLTCLMINMVMNHIFLEISVKFVYAWLNGVLELIRFLWCASFSIATIDGFPGVCPISFGTCYLRKSIW